MSAPRKAVINLDGTAAGLVMREGGEMDLVLPDFEPSDEVPMHVLLLMAIADHLQDDEFCEDMLQYMRQEACDCPDCQKHARGFMN